jgi:hypothetical protein
MMGDKRKEKNKALQNKIQGVTEKIAGNFLRTTKLDKVFDRILNWAENNRKGMFAITVSFLVLVVFMTFTNKPGRGSLEKTYNDIEIQVNQTDSISSFDVLKSKERNVTNSIEQFFLLQKLKKELAEIQKKGDPSREDSLKVREIYNIIKGDEAKQN